MRKFKKLLTYLYIVCYTISTSKGVFFCAPFFSTHEPPEGGHKLPGEPYPEQNLIR